MAAEINGLRGRLRGRRLRTDYAAVTVSLAVQGEGGEGGAAGSIDDAFGDAGELLLTAAGVLIRVLAVVLPLMLIGLLAGLAARPLRRRRRESALV
jgi:hypothetical protein